LSVFIDTSSIQEFASKIQIAQDSLEPDLTHKLVDSVNANIVTVARALAPFRTGYLRDSIHADIEGPLQVMLRADASYAAMLEYGTRAHDIFGNPVLHWQKNGQDFFATRVHHPGTRPYLFLNGAIDEGLESLLQDLTDFIAQILLAE
jgi:hypothetical protein